jgi:hypothetical protein
MQLVTAQVHRAGDDPARFANADTIEPSVYLPTALPLVAGVAWLRWEPARLVWSCLLAAAVFLSLPLLFMETDLSASGKWLVAAGALSFSPTILGLSHGNPGILACSLTMLSLYLVIKGHGGWAALALGLADCLKPQLSIAAVVLFALWGYWRPLLLSFAFPAIAAMVSVLRAPSLNEYGHWLMSLREILAGTVVPGGINDPTPANPYAYSIVNAQTVISVWAHNPVVINVLTWFLTSALVLCYLVLRRGLDSHRRLRDMAFFSAVTLTAVYHRFYDEQVLLMAVPFLVTASSKRRAWILILWVCMLILWFPLNGLFRILPATLTPASPLGFLLLRCQPLIILTMCLLLIPWRGRSGTIGSAQISRVSS